MKRLALVFLLLSTLACAQTAKVDLARQTKGTLPAAQLPTNVPNPTVPGGVANKGYVDALSFANTTLANTFTQPQIFSLSPTVPTPTNSTDAANKAYVDSHAGQSASVAPTGNSLTLGANGTVYWTIGTNGWITPNADATIYIGTQTSRLAGVFPQFISNSAAPTSVAAINNSHAGTGVAYGFGANGANQWGVDTSGNLYQVGTGYGFGTVSTPVQTGYITQMFSNNMTATTGNALGLGANGTTYWTIGTNGWITPNADATIYIGTQTSRLAGVFPQFISNSAAPTTTAVINSSHAGTGVAYGFGANGINHWSVDTSGNLFPLLTGYGIGTTAAPVQSTYQTVSHAKYPIWRTDAVTLNQFGDSITAGTGCSIAANCYAPLVASTLGFTANNQAIGGDVAAGQSVKIFATSITTNSYSTYLIGQNEKGSVAVNAANQEQYYRTILADAVWGATPVSTPAGNSQKLPIQNALVTKTGTWAAVAEFGGALGMKSVNAGDSVSASIPGSTLYVVALARDTTDSTMTVTVDGKVVGAITPRKTYDAGNAPAAPTTGDRLTYAPFAYRFKMTPLAGTASDGTDNALQHIPQHTVSVSCTSAGVSGNGCELVSLHGSGGAMSQSGPFFWLMTPYMDGFSSTMAGTALTDTLVRRVASELAQDGLGVGMFDLAAYLNGKQNAALLQADLIHPTDAGHSIIANGLMTEMAPWVAPRDKQAIKAVLYNSRNAVPWAFGYRGYSGLSTTGHIAAYLPSLPITVTRILVEQTQATFSACSTAPQVQITDGTTTAAVSIANATDTDSGALHVQFDQPKTLYASLLAGTGCSGTPDLSVTVEYQLQ